jgi:fumarate hydratase, class I
MPVTIAVDATGESVDDTGPREWRQRIGRIAVVTG